MSINNSIIIIKKRYKYIYNRIEINNIENVIRIKKIKRYQ